MFVIVLNLMVLKMKCSWCNREITECNECHDKFEKGETIICDDAETHFCSLGDYLSYNNEVQEAMVE